MIGFCLLYLCYNNGKHALRKKKNKKLRKKKIRRSNTDISNTDPEPKYSNSDLPPERPNYGTESINSILLGSSRNVSGD
jgi:hypothetical protein